MPSSDGTPGSAGFGLSAAARYREVRVNRAFYVLGVLALLLPWAVWLFGFRAAMATPASVLAAMHLTVAQLARQNLQGFVHVGTIVAPSDLFVAAALGIALFGYDRVAGGLLYALEGPLPRREIFLAKALLGAAAIILVATLGALAVLWAALASGNPDLAGAILLRSLFDAAGQLSLFATALAMGGAMGTVFSALATITWAGLPALLSGLVSIVIVRPLAEEVNGRLLAVLVPTRWATAFGQTLNNLSPFQSGGSGTWPLYDVLALIAWFVAWAVLMAWLGRSWWARAPFERLHDGVFFPPLWNAYYAFLSLASGLFVTTLITQGAVKGLGWAAIYAALFVAGWFFWRFAVSRRDRRLAGGATLGARP